MNKFKKLGLGLLTAVAVIGLAACGNEGKESKKDADKKSDKLSVVTSFSIIQDIAEEIGGDLVDVHNMVPIGLAPHEYEALPEDIEKSTNADVVFYNGLNLEGGKSGWFFKLMTSVKKEDSKVFEVMKGVEPMYLGENSGEKEMNPHAFLSPKVGMTMADNVLKAYEKADPKNADKYRENAEKYQKELEDMDKVYRDKVAEIPEKNRTLVTSEHAYQYMAKEYGLKEGYLWEIDTEENGTPEQIESLVKFVKKSDIPSLFVETNVPPKPMETVFRETKVPIFGKVYSDELGKKGTDGDTYLGFLKTNIETIHNGLMK
ncbi:MAG: zinc ABC transporter substrate-binding protein [Vagococcus sp.]|uniref:metal ABC transporter solute-binding protein, Zn/Mn family n=1 Tax=Vagococcus sp. TaxID=1933889 RepID=UPI002FC6C3E7